MFYVRDLVRQAMSLLGVIGADEDVSSTDMALGVTGVRTMYNDFAVNGMFGRVDSKVIESNYTAGDGGERLTKLSPCTVTLPLFIEENNEKRAVKDGALVIVNDTGAATRATHFYDGHVARWIDFETLTEASEAPLSSRFFYGLASILARRLAGSFGEALTQEIVAAADNCMDKMRLEFLPDMTADMDRFFAYAGRGTRAGYLA